MELNYLLSRHQVSLMRADTAASPEARIVHRTLARCYAEQIEQLRVAVGAGTIVPSLA